MPVLDHPISDMTNPVNLLLLYPKESKKIEVIYGILIECDMIETSAT